MITAKPIVIGLTGSIGAGKSSVAKIWQSLGATLISADQLARQVVEPGSPALSEIVNQFGKQFLTLDGQLDRKKLAELVFSEPELRKKLEAILHPKIGQLFQQELRKAAQLGVSIIVYEVPLLFESGYAYPEISHTVTVSAPEELCIERICARDALSRQQAKQRLLSQMSCSEKERRADFVIQNNSTLDELKLRVTEINNLITKP